MSLNSIGFSGDSSKNAQVVPVLPNFSKSEWCTLANAYCADVEDAQQEIFLLILEGHPATQKPFENKELFWSVYNFLSAKRRSEGVDTAQFPVRPDGRDWLEHYQPTLTLADLQGTREGGKRMRGVAALAAEMGMSERQMRNRIKELASDIEAGHVDLWGMKIDPDRITWGDLKKLLGRRYGQSASIDRAGQGDLFGEEGRGE